MKINSTIILLLFCFSSGEINAQTISRLKALAINDHDATGYIPTDSSTYTYSYARGSDMKTGLYSFDTSMYYTATGGVRQPALRYLRSYESSTAARVSSEVTQIYASGNWENSQRRTLHYPAALGPGNTSKTDTLLHEQWNKFTGQWHLLRRTITVYNTNQDITSETEQLYDQTLGKWVNERETANSYTANKLINRTVRRWDAGSSAWVNSETSGYLYSGNDLVRDSFLTWNTTSATWDKQYKNEYTYNAGGNNTSATRYYWKSGAWAPDHRNQYEYNTNGKVISDTLSSWDEASSAWTQAWLYTYAYNSAGDLTMTRTHTPGPDSFVYYRMQEWTYNSYNQPLRMQASEWDFVSAVWLPFNGPDAQVNYYYELFNVGVDDITTANDNLLLYPVPANSIVSLSLEEGAEGIVRLAIYDMQGRMVKYLTDQAYGRYSKTIPVSELAAGQYLLKVQAGNKEMTKALMIER